MRTQGRDSSAQHPQVWSRGWLCAHTSLQVCGQFGFLFLKLNAKAAHISLFLSASHWCHYFINHIQESCLIWLWTLKHQQKPFNNDRLETSHGLPINAESCLHQCRKEVCFFSHGVTQVDLSCLISDEGWMLLF